MEKKNCHETRLGFHRQIGVMEELVPLQYLCLLPEIYHLTPSLSPCVYLSGCIGGEVDEGQGHRRNGAVDVGGARDRMTGGVKSSGEKGAKDHSKVERNEAQT